MHRHRPQRSTTPAVIYLPPPRPPITPPRRDIAAERALPLPRSDENLVTGTTADITEPKADAPENGAAPHQSRQLRRKALRAEAKAARRRGPLFRQNGGMEQPEPQAPADDAAIDAAVPPSQPLADPDIAGPMAFAPMPEPAQPAINDADPVAPLPRNRAVVRPGARWLIAVRRWAGSLTRARDRNGPVPASLMAEQLIALRGEITAVQQRLDRLIASAAV